MEALSNTHINPLAVIEEFQTSSLPGFVNVRGISAWVERETEKWRSASRDCCKRCVREVRMGGLQAAEEASGRCEKLGAVFREIVERKLRDLEGEALAEIDVLVEGEKNFFTTDERGLVKVVNDHRWGKFVRAVTGACKDGGDGQDVKDILMEWQKGRDEGMEEIAEVLEAYHSVARGRFTDMVGLVVTRKVLSSDLISEVRRECLALAGKRGEALEEIMAGGEEGVEEDYKRLVKARRLLVEFVGRRRGRN